MKDKIIFLDFDGVLNSIGTKDRVVHPKNPEWKVRGIDNFRVKLVSDLAKKYNAKIVISSTWREYNTVPELQELLISRGFDPSIEFLGGTPVYGAAPMYGWPRLGGSSSERGDEIDMWLHENGRDRTFLVLDDMWTRFVETNQQVQTSEGTGFFQGLMKRASKILEKEYEREPEPVS
jgi:hypothetical protein